MISRIGKLLRETTGVGRFTDAQSLRARDVALLVSDETDRALARSAVALTLRCFSGTTIVRGKEGRPIPRTIADDISQEAAEYGAGDRLCLERAGGDLVLGLACSAKDGFVDARGWSVSVNELGPKNLSAAPPAAAFAAAAGVAKLFGALMRRDARILSESWTAPMLDFPIRSDESSRGPINVGRLIIVGAGAIGSGLAHVLRNSGWHGEVLVVDNQRYDEPNHETTLLISQAHAMRQAPKASTLAALFRSAGMSVESSEEKVVAGHRLLSRPADAIVCAVDNAILRRCLDNVAAGVVFNAAVGGTPADAGHVLWTRHALNEVPLSTHYRSVAETPAVPESGPEDIVTDQCSRLAYEDVSLAAPFMGLAAGALLAAGLAQRSLGIPAPTNYLKIDMLALQRWSTRKVLRVPGSSEA
jgi:hypothetical protein